MALLRRRSGSRGGADRGSDNPFTERGFIAAAAVLTVVLLSGATVLMSSPTPPPPPATGSSEASEPDATGVPQDAETAGTPSDLATDGACPELPAQDQSRPSAQPPDTVWRDVDGMALPFSPRVGPAQTSGAVARCYAHTPAGAVFAAIQGAWRYQRARDWGAIAQYVLAPGPGRDAYIRQRTDRTGPNAAPFTPDQVVGIPQAVGFRVVSYAPERAEIDVVNAPVSAGLGFHVVWTVEWSGADWRLVLGADGAAPRGTEVQMSDAFVPWDQESMASAFPVGPGADESEPTGPPPTG